MGYSHALGNKDRLLGGRAPGVYVEWPDPMAPRGGGGLTLWHPGEGGILGPAQDHSCCCLPHCQVHRLRKALRIIRWPELPLSPNHHDLGLLSLHH